MAKPVFPGIFFFFFFFSPVFKQSPLYLGFASPFPLQAPCCGHAPSTWVLLQQLALCPIPVSALEPLCLSFSLPVWFKCCPCVFEWQFLEDWANLWHRRTGSASAPVAFCMQGCSWQGLVALPSLWVLMPQRDGLCWCRFPQASQETSLENSNRCGSQAEFYFPCAIWTFLHHNQNWNSENSIILSFGLAFPSMLQILKDSSLGSHFHHGAGMQGSKMLSPAEH